MLNSFHSLPLRVYLVCFVCNGIERLWLELLKQKKHVHRPNHKLFIVKYCECDHDTIQMKQQNRYSLSSLSFLCYLLFFLVVFCLSCSIAAVYEDHRISCADDHICFHIFFKWQMNRFGVDDGVNIHNSSYRLCFTAMWTWFET